MDALNHKLTALDKKINAMTRLEFKVEQVSERVEEVGVDGCGCECGWIGVWLDMGVGECGWIWAWVDMGGVDASG